MWYISLDFDTRAEARSGFSWDVPSDYNIARDFLQKHDNPGTRPALHQVYPDGRRKTYTFADLDERSNRLANALAGFGVERGDRVAVLLPQVPSNPLTHLACWKLAAVSVPMSVLFGEESMRYRLQQSDARVAVVDSSRCDTVRDIATDCPNLDHVIEVDWRTRDTRDNFTRFVNDASPKRKIADTDAETEAIVMFTSGSTGRPKGVVHTHGLWIGTCPSFWMANEGRIWDGSVYWTPADWAWIGALGNIVFPPWHYGRPVVGYPMGKFQPKRAFELLEEFDVTNSFIPPTALRMMATVQAPADTYDLELDVIASGSEPLSSETQKWVNNELPDTVVNEIYGQTEANVFATECHSWFDPKSGSIGKSVPGHETAIVDPETGTEKPVGNIGEFAIRYADDPMVYKCYLNDPAATEQARVNGWHCTGDLGKVDEQGYLYFKSRADELIITSGYRVGPEEVESVLLDHPAVEQVGVIGVPDETRGEIVKAFVVADDEAIHDVLLSKLQEYVRENLAKYAYPREIEFVDDLPTTTTGKVRRHDLRARETTDDK